MKISSSSPASAFAAGYGGQESRGFCPSCHQRRALSTGDWIAHRVCREVPHRQFASEAPRR